MPDDIEHGDWVISCDRISGQFFFYHRDYDGEGDGRYGWADSISQAMEMIDEMDPSNAD